MGAAYGKLQDFYEQVAVVQGLLADGPAVQHLPLQQILFWLQHVPPQQIWFEPQQ